MELLCSNSDITPSFVRYDDEEEEETPSWASSQIQLSSAFRHTIRGVHAVSARPRRLEVVVKVRREADFWTPTLGDGGGSSWFL